MKGNSVKTWYKDAIIYQCHVRSFQDSNGDGIGDFKGLIQKLDYLKVLGVNALWLLPFYKSPLRDGGYDISDFTSIHEDYGTMADFRRFISEAHKRDLRVITELVLNHTSNEHPWFERARKARPGSVYRDFYVWNDSTDKYNDARIIFNDFEISNWSWDPVAKAYYWHRFYSHQPDLNFDNPSVQKAVVKVLDFWFKTGVDGLRLDAVPYLFEREDTNCENLPETHAFLKRLRKYIDENFENKMLLAEANQWPEDASAYFGNGDECQMCFHFPLMPRLYISVRMEDRFPLIDILEQTPEIPENCQWAIFLRNHDELTLEMVSDEERDYMYNSFTRDSKQRINQGIRRRLAPLLLNDRKSIELMNILLFSLPGTPIIYYGDEIGMGDNFYLGDRDGVRTPMQWSADKNAGFSTAEPQRLFLPVIFNYDYHYQSINVDNHEKNPTSLLWWMRRVIAKRKHYKAFSRGRIQFIDASNLKVLAFTRTYEDEIILVVINISRYSQLAQLDLREFSGYIPTEVFSQNDFPQIGDTLYTFPLQFKNYFWFELHKPEGDKLRGAVSLDYEFKSTRQQWNSMYESTKQMLNELLNEYMQKSRWFRGKARKVKDISIADAFPFGATDGLNSYIMIVNITYIQGKDEYYQVPLSLSAGDSANSIRSNNPESVISDVEIDGNRCLLFDGMYDPQVRNKIFEVIVKREKLSSKEGRISGVPGKQMNKKNRKYELPLSSRVLSADQSNTSLLYENLFFFKMYRNPDVGDNPEIEIIKELTEQTSFRSFPTYEGALEYEGDGKGKISLGILVDFIPNEGNAWEFTRSAIESYFDRILAEKEELTSLVGDRTDQITEIIGRERMTELIGPFFCEMMELLGRRTAEMHLALASIKNNKEFVEEPFSLLYQKSLYQSFRNLIKRTISQMKSASPNLSEDQKELIDGIIKNEDVLLSVLKSTLEQKKLDSSKIRVHGDYHLGQVLFTGKDFIIIDFEGEPIRSLTSRKLKHSPFKDLAGMLRSFHYAIYMGQLEYHSRLPGGSGILQPWIETWYKSVQEIFISSYLEAAGDASFIPQDQQKVSDLLSVFTIEKVIYEADYELNNRPDWLHIPLNGLNELLNNLARQK